ncbi:thermonuclease family protein [Flaviflagellibacter deserti]|uniref:Thermonuclease family protein n=1 Tax=Flaviflagellibacter deserti TaxID=2267266 RepID=A0ABV9Z1D0_9HYPH
MRLLTGPILLVALVLGEGRPAFAECPPAPIETIAGLQLVEDGLRSPDGRVFTLAGMILDTSGRDRLGRLTAYRPVILRPAGPADRWGRFPVHPETGGVLIEETLLAEGLGHAAALSRPACLETLLQMEAKARAARLGVWRGSGYVIRAADGDALVARLGEHVVAEGQVISTRKVRDRVYLNFAKYWRRGLSLIVAEKDWSAMADGRPAEALSGKVVRVRGRLEWRGGPVILADPREPIEPVVVGQVSR